MAVKKQKNPKREWKAKPDGTEVTMDSKGIMKLYIGARVMLTMNQWTEKGLVNGSMGTIHDIRWEAGKVPKQDLPSVIMVIFDKYNGSSYNDNPEGAVPIFPQTSTFVVQNEDCERTQFIRRRVREDSQSGASSLCPWFVGGESCGG